MKKFSIYCSFLLFSVHIMAQSPLVMPQSDHHNVSGILKHLSVSGLPQVQSRNFVELQLDSILSTQLINTGNPYLSSRILFTYLGDTTLLKVFILTTDGEPSYTYDLKYAYDDQNRLIYSEEATFSPNGTSIPVNLTYFYYNSDFPMVTDSVRAYFRYDNGDFDPNYVQRNDLVPGTSLIKKSQRETFSGEILSSQSTATYEYDAQQREILEYNEFISFLGGTTNLLRYITEYRPDTIITTRATQVAPDWIPEVKTVEVFDPISDLRTQYWGFNWNEMNGDWEENIQTDYVYDTEDRLVFATTQITNENSVIVFARKIDFLQEDYIDRISYYDGADTTTLNALTSMEQYYYSMISSTTQPNAETAQVELAPNPAHTYLRARTEQNIQLAELYDLQGRLVMNIATEGTNVLHLHRNNLPSGTYVLRLQLENGATVSERVQWE